MLDEVKPQFRFYEIVRAKSDSALCREHSELAGLDGIILGISQGEHQCAYSVHFDQFDEGWFLMEDELEPTGRMDRRDRFYDGTHIRVSVDPETGEGRVVDVDDSDQA